MLSWLGACRLGRGVLPTNYHLHHGGHSVHRLRGACPYPLVLTEIQTVHDLTLEPNQRDHPQLARITLSMAGAGIPHMTRFSSPTLDARRGCRGVNTLPGADLTPLLAYGVDVRRRQGPMGPNRTVEARR